MTTAVNYRAGSKPHKRDKKVVRSASGIRCSRIVLWLAETVCHGFIRRGSLDHSCQTWSLCSDAPGWSSHTLLVTYLEEFATWSRNIPSTLKIYYYAFILELAVSRHLFHLRLPNSIFAVCSIIKMLLRFNKELIV